MYTGTFKVFSGNANRPLAQSVCTYLDRPVCRADVTRFSDNEISAELGENVRGVDCFIIQSTSSPANDNLMELLIMIDAMRRASAASITAVIPYYGYARQDRKTSPRVPITSKLIADLLESAGATRVVSLDLHAGQIQGFFSVPFDHIYAMPVLLNHLKKRFDDPSKVVIVSPDAGGAERARAYSKRLGASLAIIDKRRVKANVAEVVNLIGDVQDKDVVLLDDMIDTAGTLTQAAVALREHGAKTILAYAVHGVLSGPAIDRLNKSEIEEVVVTDTIKTDDKEAVCEKLRVLSVAWLLGEAIRRIHNADSLSSLFV